MSSWINARKLLAVISLALLLLATLIPAGSGLLSAILAPLWLFLAAVVVVAIRRGNEVCNPPSFFVPQVHSSRAPPILSSL
jgi:hypothetical protein